MMTSGEALQLVEEIGQDIPSGTTRSIKAAKLSAYIKLLEKRNAQLQEHVKSLLYFVRDMEPGDDATVDLARDAVGEPWKEDVT